MRELAVAVPIVLLLASAHARCEDAVAALGKQRAAASRMEWQVGDASHPVLGDVRYARTTTPVTTPVGISRVVSNVYISCSRAAGTIAIELTNQASPDDPGGLPPARMPRLVCKAPSPAGAGAGGSVQDPIEVEWMVNGLGDAMAHGFRPAALRRCSTIGIVEEIALPKGWAQRTVPVQFEITPYAKGVDSIFVACGEKSAYGPAAAAPVATAAPAAAKPPSAATLPGTPTPPSTSTPPSTPTPPAAPRAPAEAPWKSARTSPHGRTYVRAEPNTHSTIVITLDPGAVILVQAAGGDWYRAKGRSGVPFEGYIREDRLVVK